MLESIEATGGSHGISGGSTNPAALRGGGIESAADCPKAASLRKKVSRVIRAQSLKKPARENLCQPYERLIRQWYQEYPFLKATQVYERLQSYGFPGGYGTVKRHTRPLRQRKSQGFHELEFLPGEEAQIDWMEWRFPFGVLYGFMFLLAYSRYLFVHFYPRHSLEFFLDGHIRAFQEIQGVAHRHRYDNLKSVVLKRTPEITINPQFLDFSRHYGFSIHPCTPGRANEKGRVERAIRDLKDFLKITPCQDLYEANRKTYFWRQQRNQRLHRSTDQKPADLLKEEKLKPLPQISYRPHRIVLAQISKTGFVQLDTNRSPSLPPTPPPPLRSGLFGPPGNCGPRKTYCPLSSIF